jgi:hypothetical protein
MESALSLAGSTLTASPERAFGYAATVLLGVMALKNTFLKAPPVPLAPPAVVQFVAPVAPDPCDLMTQAITLADACLLQVLNVQLEALVAGMAALVPSTLKGFVFGGQSAIHGMDPDRQEMRILLLKIWNNKVNTGIPIVDSGIHGVGKVRQFTRRLPRLLKSNGHVDPRAARAAPGNGVTFHFAAIRIIAYGIDRHFTNTDKFDDKYFEFFTCRSDTAWPVAFATIVYYACHEAGGYSTEQCAYMAVAKTIQCIGLSYGILPGFRAAGHTPVNVGVAPVTFP